MPKGIYKRTLENTRKPEEYETDSAECFFCRAEAILRSIYYSYKDCEIYGETDHEHVKDMVDSMIYNIFEAEKTIAKNSSHKPTPRPEVHGNERHWTEVMSRNMNQYYRDLRRQAKERLSTGGINMK